MIAADLLRALYLDFGFAACCLRDCAEADGHRPQRRQLAPVQCPGNNRHRAWDRLPLRHERPDSRSVPIAWTRQVTVADIICGVDIGAKVLDAHVGRDGAWQQFERTEAGIAELAAFCQHHEVGLVVMEATGGYERLPFGLLWTAGLAVAIVNPRSVRRFAEAMGKLEKTDRIDCGMIVWYAQTKRIQPRARSSISPRWWCGCGN